MNTSPIRISIVTPSYNQVQYLEECVRSVKEQNHLPYEHIVVDGASTDGTVELLRELSSSPGYEHLRWISEPDKGQSDALNKGFQSARGDLIGWLNADDKYRPGCFEHVVTNFGRFKQCDVLYGDYTLIDRDNRCLQIRREISFSPFVLAYHKVLYIPTTATFFDQRIFREGNFVDIQYHYAMDYEFFLRLSRRGYRFRHVPKLLADFRWHPESKTGRAAWKQTEEQKLILARYSPRFSHGSFSNGSTLSLLRSLAAVRRYGEKLLRGYYFTQFQGGRITGKWDFGTK
jgi:glycosyltransferase involved in cell wall biosynthesis